MNRLTAILTAAALATCLVSPISAQAQSGEKEATESSSGTTSTRRDRHATVKAKMDECRGQAKQQNLRGAALQDFMKSCAKE